MAITVLGGRIYAIGGGAVLPTNGGIVTESYDPALNAWRGEVNMPGGKGRASAASVLGKIFVIGGSDTSGVVSRLVRRLDP